MNTQLDGESSMEARYQRAQTLEQGSIRASKLVLNAALVPNWIGDSDCFWYERDTCTGKQCRLVDAEAGSNEAAFDHSALAAVLSDVSGEKADAEDLPIKQVAISLSPLQVSFSAFERHWRFDADQGSCSEIPAPPAAEHLVVSPDGKQAIFLRDYNLWVRDLDTDVERALTNDGERYYSYGVMPDKMSVFFMELGSTLRPPQPAQTPKVLWSSDAKRLLTIQTDDRQVASAPYVAYLPRDGSVRPQYSVAKMAYPGDEDVTAYRVLAIDVETGTEIAAQYPPLLDGYSNDIPFSTVFWWSPDSRLSYFVDKERGEKKVSVVEFDTHTGNTRVLLEEVAETCVDLALFMHEPLSILPLPESKELIWFSQRSGWAHLYLYDLETGQLKNTITQGDWLVRNLLHYDVARRELFFLAAGRVDDRDPYYREVCRVNIDSKEIVTLASSDHNYIVHKPGDYDFHCMSVTGWEVGNATGVSPSGNYFVTTCTRADEIPVSELRDRDGQVVVELEAADVSGLPDGWQWPEPVKLTAADGKTDIYGLVFRPSDFSPDKQYPVIDYHYCAPYMPFVPKGAFHNDILGGNIFWPAAANAELGFITVIIDGRGTPLREKAFHDHSYGRLHTASDLTDHIAGIRQLAERYPYMDLDRVGITGFPSGNATVDGLCNHSDFYKVGALRSVYDIRMWLPIFGERFQGLPESSDYEQSLPSTLARNGDLQGKLLIVHGLRDMDCPTHMLCSLLEALIQNNKDFDLVLEPHGQHLWTGYGLRRVWDYFVMHLQNEKPPKEFKLTTGLEILGVEA